SLDDNEKHDDTNDHKEEHMNDRRIPLVRWAHVSETTPERILILVPDTLTLRLGTMTTRCMKGKEGDKSYQRRANNWRNLVRKISFHKLKILIIPVGEGLA
ncbi:MAG TPA: hypothetical protein VJN71_06035, partial [Nitrososphaerales archaeon]|nr:hypothetical protein [Nitrososphaerales archaeon]